MGITWESDCSVAGPISLSIELSIVLRLLPPFAGALREKNHTRASFNKIPTNYISVESLINLLYEKNALLAMFSFSMCQEAVRRETTEGSSIEFIGYRIPPHEQNGCTVLFTRRQSTKVCRAFSIFWLVIEIFTSKVGVAKICETCCVNGHLGEKVLNIKISRHTLVWHYLWSVLAKFHDNPSNLHTL